MWTIIIIAVFILINIYQSIRALQGNWKTTDEFVESSGVEIFMNIDGIIKKNTRFIFTRGDDSVIMDGHLYFVIANPLTLFLFGGRGIVKCGDLSEVFPSWMHYYFDPITSRIRFWRDTLLGEFVRFD
jgi:hypothetical protein